MKTISPIKYLYCFMAVFLIIGCSDDGPEPIDPVDPDPDPVISDNPVVRLNSGGTEIAYGDVVFTEDDFFDMDGEAFSNPSITDVAETDMDELYSTERISSADLGSFSYNIPITNGTYKVKLHFAEIFWGAPDGGEGGADKRVFDISIEGNVVLTDFDMFAEAGAVSAIIKEYEVTVSDEELNISFTASIDRPKLSALEVLGDGQLLNPDAP